MENLPAEPLDYLQKDDPRSIYNYLTPSLQQALERVPEDYWNYEEEDLVERIQQGKRYFPRELALLRTRMWDLHARAVDQQQKRLTAVDICAGICSPSYFRHAILRNPLIAAYLARPPVDYMEAAEEALTYGVHKLRQILDFPLYTDKGKPDTKVAKMQLEVVKLLDSRVKGAPTQKHEIRQQTMQVNASMKEVKAIQEVTSMEELEKTLKKLRGEEEKHELLEEKRPTLEEFKKEAQTTKVIEVERVPVTKRAHKREF